MSAPTSEIGYASDGSSGGWWGALERETTPELQWPRSVAVYEAMSHQDAQVTSVLRAVTLPVERTTWRIDPAGARAEVVALIAEDLRLPVVGQPDVVPGRARDRFSWSQHLHEALTMVRYGHAFFEQLCRIDSRGRVRLWKLALRPAHTVAAINVARDGGLVSIEQHTPPWQVGEPVWRARPIPVSRLVAYAHDREAGAWTGRSLLRPAYKFWLLKDRLLRVQATSIERNGMGVPLYKGAPGEADLSVGRKLAQDWRSGDAAGGAVPHDADLVLRGVEGNTPDADPVIRYYDEQIARAVLAHFLNLGTQTGSWALGSTFADFFTMSLQTLAEQVAAVANQHIVEDLVDWNFGPDEPAPRIVPDEIGGQPAVLVQAMKLLVDAGILRPDRPLEEFMRQTLGLPPKPSPEDT